MNRIVAAGLLAFCLVSIAAADQLIDGKRAAEIFEKLKSQSGIWRGRSTKGWENRLQVKVISKGSVVLNTSEFIESPGEGMATTFYMDGERLLLTHYCEAGNQPTLVATSEAPNGEITFAFLRGTNMPDRNAGHMDKVIYRFVDHNRYSSQWTWFSKGKETWLENIEYERLK